MTNAPLVEMRGIEKHFGGVHAVRGVDVDLFAGEVVGILGHNGAGKSVLMEILSGSCAIDGGEIRINGETRAIRDPRDARALGIETIHQTLALADNLDVAANLFLGRELTTNWGVLDDGSMDEQAIQVLQRLNPQLQNIKALVSNLSGGQRQSVAIARAILFDARILIMDEPTAALGPGETAMVGDLINKLKNEGIGIFLISHDLHDVFDLADRIMVMKNGRKVGMHPTRELSREQVLAMIILGQPPEDTAKRDTRDDT
jgi:D-xylose transport system ATP-binding protein